MHYSLRSSFWGSFLLSTVVRYCLFFMLGFWGIFAGHGVVEGLHGRISAIFFAAPQAPLTQIMPMTQPIAEIMISPSLTHQEPNFYQ